MFLAQGHSTNDTCWDRTQDLSIWSPTRIALLVIVAERCHNDDAMLMKFSCGVRFNPFVMNELSRHYPRDEPPASLVLQE